MTIIREEVGKVMDRVKGVEYSQHKQKSAVNRQEDQDDDLDDDTPLVISPPQRQQPFYYENQFQKSAAIDMKQVDDMVKRILEPIGIEQRHVLEEARQSHVNLYQKLFRQVDDFEDKLGEHEIRIASNEAALNNINSNLTSKILRETDDFRETNEGIFGSLLQEEPPNVLQTLDGNLHAKYDGVVQIKCN